MLQLRIEAMSTGRDIELPTMPGTSHNVLLQRPLCKRASGVWTDSVHRMEGAINIEQRHNSTTDDELAPFACRDFGN